VREIPPGESITSAEVCPADAPGEAMIYSDLSFNDVFAARESHESPRFNITNGELMKSAKKKFPRKSSLKSGCPGFPRFSSRFSRFFQKQLAWDWRSFAQS
jgi:hypothetical protein